jgi:hypothetical protein
MHEEVELGLYIQEFFSWTLDGDELSASRSCRIAPTWVKGPSVLNYPTDRRLSGAQSHLDVVANTDNLVNLKTNLFGLYPTILYAFTSNTNIILSDFCTKKGLSI